MSRRLLARSIVPTVLVVALLGAGPASPAAATESFTLHGAGWGHGIGMSQYGAYGLALKGWKPVRIVRWYYTGVRVQRREPPAPVVRVGLLQHRSRLTLQAVGGAFELRRGRRLLDTVRAGDSRTVAVDGGRYRILTAGGTTVGGRTWGGLLRAHPRGGVVRVPEWGHAVGRGHLELPTTGQTSLHLVAVQDPEEYLFGLAEVPSSWPQAALRAQAIAGRTYAFRVVASGGRSGCACDILGDTRDQAYAGWDKEAGTAGGRWVKAVRATERKVATYGGELISTLYSSSSGGYTEDVENVWGGSPHPYLKGKCDPGDWVASNPNRTWRVTMSGTEVASRLRASLGWDVAEVTKLAVGERGVSGRAVRVVVKGRGSGGGSFSASTSGWSLRSALGMKDTRFWVGSDRNVTGAIREAYDALTCRPGLPKGPHREAEGGTWQAFQRGRMYARDGVAVWLRKPVLGAYLGAGGPSGFLGYPTSRVRKLSDGTRVADFEGGRISCPPEAACAVLPG